jgi:predicted DNA binding CopG/RHH family protein
LKTVQYLSDEQLAQARGLSPDQVLQFLHDFQQLHHGVRTRSKLISLKVPENLLNAFRTKADLTGIAYQTQIKRLMEQWAAD